MSYARELKTPKGIQDGTANHVQMIINELEAENPREALYLAVDLLDQLIGKEPALVITMRYPPLDAKALADSHKQGYEEGFTAGQSRGAHDARKSLVAKLSAALQGAA